MFVCLCAVYVCLKFNISVLMYSCTYLLSSVILHHVLTGNLYTMRGEHENAVTHFKLATRIDHTNLSAWILLGHSYIELRNPTLAIEAYTRALGEYYGFLVMFI